MVAITVRHQGGGNRQFIRLVDFKRDKHGIPAKVACDRIRSEPHRSPGAACSMPMVRNAILWLRLVCRLAIRSCLGRQAEIRPGNSLPIANIPVGTMIHNIELQEGKGGQLVRAAGTAAQLLAKEGDYAQIRLPSGEVRLVRQVCYATIGQVGNLDHSNVKLGKAGRKRHMGIRPTVRGTAMTPRDHPHGGGEGRQPIGMPGPKTPWGKPTRGLQDSPQQEDGPVYCAPPQSGHPVRVVG